MCVCVDWDSALLPNEALLDTVSRFVLAVLLKHTGLMGQACGEGRYDIIFCITREFYTVDTTKEFLSYFLSSDISHVNSWQRCIAVCIRCGIASWLARTWSSSRHVRHHENAEYDKIFFYYIISITV